MAKSFQVKHGEDWKDLRKWDKCLKQAFMEGRSKAKFHGCGQTYVYDFKTMKEINTDTRQECEIRPPHNLKAPSKPFVPRKWNISLVVPPGAPGTTIHVPNPRKPGKLIAVDVPPTALVGEVMLVPARKKDLPEGPRPTPDVADAPPAVKGGGYLKAMKQIIKDACKVCAICPAYKFKSISKPLVLGKGNSMMIVPPGAPGTTIRMPCPHKPGKFIPVDVLPTALVGEVMLVPARKKDLPEVPRPTQDVADAAPAVEGGGGGWSIGSKVAGGFASGTDDSTADKLASCKLLHSTEASKYHSEAELTSQKANENVKTQSATQKEAVGSSPMVVDKHGEGDGTKSKLAASKPGFTGSPLKQKRPKGTSAPKKDKAEGTKLAGIYEYLNQEADLVDANLCSLGTKLAGIYEYLNQEADVVDANLCSLHNWCAALQGSFALHKDGHVAAMHELEEKLGGEIHSIREEHRMQHCDIVGDLAKQIDKLTTSLEEESEMRLQCEERLGKACEVIDKLTTSLEEESKMRLHCEERLGKACEVIAAMQEYQGIGKSSVPRASVQNKPGKVRMSNMRDTTTLVKREITDSMQELVEKLDSELQSDSDQHHAKHPTPQEACKQKQQELCFVRRRHSVTSRLS